MILWAADTGVEVARYQGSAVWPHVAFSADGTLVLATDATQVTAWSAQGRRRMSFVPNPDELIAATNLDATRVITRRTNGQLLVRDAATGAQLGREPLHTQPGMEDDGSSALSSDGRRFAAAAAAGKVAVIDLQDGSTIASIDVGHDPTGLRLDRSGDRLLVLGDGAAKVWIVSAHARWRVVDGKLVAVLGHIEGRVMHAGAPVGRTRVFAKLEPYHVAYEALTNDDGSYVIDELPFGAYSVNAGSGAPVTANVASREPVRIDITQ